MWPYLAFGASLLAVMVLVIADTKIGIPLAQCALVAAFWPVFGALYWWRVMYMGQDPAQMAWLGATGYAAVIVASVGRPILIMWDALPGRARTDPHLDVRSRIATIVFLAVVSLAVILMA